MRNLLISVFLVVIPSVAFPCSFDTECDVGFKCTKQGTALYGVCTGKSYGGGAPKDSGPKDTSYGSKAGNTCNTQYDCGVGGQCIKVGTSLTGTCSK
jgi:hypothetical protein